MIGIISKFTLCVMLCLGAGFSSSANAQMTDATAAKDAYFAAQSLYDSGQFDEAKTKLDEAKRLRGTTDAYFLALRARIDLGREAYTDATYALIAFSQEPVIGALVESLRDVRIAVDNGLTRSILVWTDKCKAGEAWACYNIGHSYRYEYYGRYSLDLAIAISYYNKSCDAGYEPACSAAATILENGDNGP